MPTILLIRHAQASFGAPDYDVLSDLGKRQAGVLAAALKLRGLRAERVVTGSSRRHVETADALVHADVPPPVIEPRWNEYEVNDVLTHYGDSAARIDRRPDDTSPVLSPREFQAVLTRALSEWVSEAAGSDSTPSWPEFAARGMSALEELADDLGAGETAAVFTSAGVIAAICSSLLGLPEKGFVELSRVTVNTGVTKIVRGAGGTSLVSFNDHSHLEAVGRSLVTYH